MTTLLLPLLVVLSATAYGQRMAVCPNGDLPKLDDERRPVQCLPGFHQRTICGAGHSCYFSGLNYMCCPTNEPNSKYEPTCPSNHFTVLDHRGYPLKCHHRTRKCPTKTMYCHKSQGHEICCESVIIDGGVSAPPTSKPKSSLESQPQCPRNSRDVFDSKGAHVKCDQSAPCAEKSHFCYWRSLDSPSVCCESLLETTSSSSASSLASQAIVGLNDEPSPSAVRPKDFLHDRFGASPHVLIGGGGSDSTSVSTSTGLPHLPHHHKYSSEVSIAAKKVEQQAIKTKPRKGLFDGQSWLLGGSTSSVPIDGIDLTTTDRPRASRRRPMTTSSTSSTMMWSPAAVDEELEEFTTSRATTAERPFWLAEDIVDPTIYTTYEPETTATSTTSTTTTTTTTTSTTERPHARKRKPFALEDTPAASAALFSESTQSRPPPVGLGALRVGEYRNEGGRNEPSYAPAATLKGKARASKTFSSQDKRALAQQFLLEQIRRGWPYHERFYRPESDMVKEDEAQQQQQQQQQQDAVDESSLAAASSTIIRFSDLTPVKAVKAVRL